MERDDTPPWPARRRVLKTLGAIGAGAGLMGPTAEALAATAGRVVLPFDNGERELVAFPQKCWRRFKSDQACRLNFDQGPAPGFLMPGCG